MKSNADKHGMKSAAKREPHEHRDHHAHMAADFRKRFLISLVLTLPILGLSPVLQKTGGIARGHRLCRRSLRSVRAFYRRMLLWRLAVSQRAVWRACLASARGDETCRCCHHYGLCLQQRRGVWPDRHDVVLGVDHPRRHHAAGTLGRDEVGDGCLESPGGSCETHAFGRSQTHGRRQRDGRVARRSGGG